MKMNLGGMEFRSGCPIDLPPPPSHIPAHTVRVVCPRVPDVHIGQAVRVGQPLVEFVASDVVGCVSPMNGTVGEIASFSSEGDQSPARYEVVIEPDDKEIHTQQDLAPPRDRTLDGWFDVLKRMGPWALRDGGVGLVAQLEAARDHPPERLICVGLDSFPPYPVRSSLLMSFPDDVVLGTLALADLVGAKKTTMLASRYPSVLTKLKPSCRNFRLRLETRDNVYPCADPTLVVWAHTPGHRRLPVGANPVKETRTMLVNPWTAIRVGRWLTQYKFDLVRPMMIGSLSRATPMTGCYALPGQPLASLDPRLSDALLVGSPVIMGNPMADGLMPLADRAQGGGNGHVVPNDELLVTILETIVQPNPEPCISCGWCVDLCPTGLQPHRMLEQCDRGDDGLRMTEQLRWCIDCGLCSHVCPSSLPLAQTFRAALASPEKG